MPTLLSGPICSENVMSISAGEASTVEPSCGLDPESVASACAVGAQSDPTNANTVSERSQPRAGRADGRIFMSSQQR